MGRKVGSLADRLDQVVQDNEGDIQPAIASIRQAAEKVNATLDPPTQKNLQTTVQRLSAGSARLDKILADIGPLAADLGGKPSHVAQTAFGQSVMRINRISYDLNLLTSQLSDGRGGLNRNGSLQKLLTQPELYNNLNTMASGAGRVVALAERVLANMNRFAERIANDPGAIGRGALQR